MRKSSINFEQIGSINRALAHAHREEEAEPTYLLPKDMRLGHFVVSGSGDKSYLQTRFADKKASMTGQARARNSSPFWEGVMVLPEIDGSLEAYKATQERRLQEWALAYQEETKHSVLHICVHLDEGYVGEDGKAVYNPHAHVIIDRLNSNGRVIKLGRAQLSRVQDLTSTVMKMERGETLDERKGKFGRRHMGHHEYRRYAAAKREAEANYELGVSDGSEIVAIDAARSAEKAVGASKRREAYLELRGFLKGSQKAVQSDYMSLKALYEASSDPRFEALSSYIQQENPDPAAVLDFLSDGLKRPVNTGDEYNP